MRRGVRRRGGGVPAAAPARVDPTRGSGYLAGTQATFTAGRTMSRTLPSPNQTPIEQIPAGSILVVDDDDNMLKLLAKCLRQGQYSVVTAPSGRAALDLLGKQSFSVVITDMFMPEMSGLELLARFRQSLPSVPVIVVTGMPGVEAAVECMRVGAFDYISKPFRFDQVLDLVRRAEAEHQRLCEQSQSKSYPVLNPGRFFGSYRIIKLLGEGSVGLVFLVEKTGVGDPPPRYALKVLKPTYRTEDPSGVVAERFLREALAASAVKHPGVVAVIEGGVTPDERIPFIVMEYVEGRTLKYYTENPQTLDYPQKAGMVLQVAEALGAIHQAGIRHRDVKPHNIVVTAAGQVKLMDFGIAHLPDSELTVSHELLGSPAYCAPEAFGEGPADERADLFSLGVVAYELCLGLKPFVGSSISNYAHVIRNERPREPRRVDPNFPLRLQRIIARLLKKAPADRYPDAAALVADLRAYLDGRDDPGGVLGTLTQMMSRDWR